MFSFKKYAISFSLSVIIFILCMINPTDLPASPMTNFDKIAHWMMFMALSGAVFFDETGYFRRKTSGWRLFWGSFVFPVVFSGIIELIQEYASTCRTGDWNDFLFDGIGAFCGLFICWIINKRLTCPD